MGKRSRLRTQNVGRRRLVALILLLLIALGTWAWLEKEYVLLLWEQAERIINLGKDQLANDQEITRGTIYDRNYKEFAISYERVSVYANIREIEDLNQVVGPLSAILETSESDLYDRMGEGRLRVWLAKDISQDQEDEIKKLTFSGIHLHKEYIRYYPQRESAAHLIGFVERDTGLSGIEHYLNKLEAKYRLQKDKIDDLPKMGDTRPGVDGRHLILTLDAKIQRLLEDYLKRLSATSPGSKFGALVMEATSGAIIGYTQIPSFDPNNFHSYAESAFVDLFNEKIAVPNEFKIFLKDLSLLESQAGSGFAPLPWSLAAEQRKLGVQLQLWNKLGADGRLQFDFISTPPPEVNAVPYQNEASGGINFETVPEMLTPLHLLTAVTRAVNGGLEITPHGSKSFVLRKNQQEFLLEDLEKQPRTGLLGDGVAEEAPYLFGALGSRGPLGSTIVQGTSSSVLVAEMELLFHHYLGMIMVPQKNPELVMLVTSTGPGYQVSPRQEVSPSAEAMKIIGQITALQQVMKNLSDMMSPKEPENINYRLVPGEAVVEEKEPSAAEVEMEMASFIGMSLRKCLRLLQSSNVEIEIEGTGRVVSQYPPPGTKLKPGTKVTLILKQDEIDPGFKQPQRTEPE